MCRGHLGVSWGRGGVCPRRRCRTGRRNARGRRCDARCRGAPTCFGSLLGLPLLELEDGRAVSTGSSAMNAYCQRQTMALARAAFAARSASDMLDFRDYVKLLRRWRFEYFKGAVGRSEEVIVVIE